jgi:4-nitrophenyl phosphatase
MSLLPAYIRALILDMDGVLWSENTPIGNLQAVFESIVRRGLKVCMATNNATRTPEQYLERLSEFGVKNLELWQILTSPEALAHELSKRFRDRGCIYTIGETGLVQALTEAGFTVIDETNWDASRQMQAVVIGMDRNISYAKLRRAALLIQKEVPFYATNPDKTFPTPEGLIPGAGALIAALVTATGVEPLVVGKPARFLMDLARERMQTAPAETLVVGDRLETDIAGGQAAGCPVALVLSGVTSLEAAHSWMPAPDIIAPDLATLVG